MSKHNIDLLFVPLVGVTARDKLIPSVFGDRVIERIVVPVRPSRLDVDDLRDLARGACRPVDPFSPS